MQAQQLNKLLVWKSTLVQTTEHTTVKQNSSGFSVEGNITGQEEGNPFQTIYHLDINSNWEIQSFRIDFISNTSFQIGLHKNNAGQWVNSNNEIQTQLTNCLDIDISLTPFTNTLPIRRLNLPAGVSRVISVVYIDLPAKCLKPADQRYTNLGNGIYRYESLDSGFTADLKVDHEGFVYDYPGIWTRVTFADQI